jgi:hypothetical protein
MKSIDGGQSALKQLGCDAEEVNAVHHVNGKPIYGTANREGSYAHSQWKFNPSDKSLAPYVPPRDGSFYLLTQKEKKSLNK